MVRPSTRARINNEATTLVLAPCGVITINTPHAAMPTTSNRLKICWPEKRYDFLIKPCSLPKAIKLPEKEEEWKPEPPELPDYSQDQLNH